MKRSKAYVNNRRDQIVAILEKDGKANVSDLAERFGVSPLTIRRDLDYLEERKILSREYGTAKLLNPMGRPSGSRQIRAIAAISRLAARYVDDGDYTGGFSREDIAALLESLDSNHLGWSAAMAPVIMGNPDRPELTAELTNSFCRTDPEIARQFARVTFLSDNRADLPGVHAQRDGLVRGQRTRPGDHGHAAGGRAHDDLGQLPALGGHGRRRPWRLDSLLR